jgi:hypothetical protein
MIVDILWKNDKDRNIIKDTYERCQKSRIIIYEKSLKYEAI